MIALYIFSILLLIGTLQSGHDKTSKPNTQEKVVEKESLSPSPTITVDVKNALGKWSQGLPTEYHLEPITTYCSKSQDKSPCATDLDKVNKSEIIEGYSLVFTKGSDDTGKGHIFMFSTVSEADNYYQKRIGLIQVKRGYKEIKGQQNCFGWEEDLNIVTAQHILCVKKNAVYEVGLQRMFSVSSSDIKKYSDALGATLT